MNRRGVLSLMGAVAAAGCARTIPATDRLASRPVTVLSGIEGAEGIAIDPAGRIYLSRADGVVSCVPGGPVRLEAEIASPAGLALDGCGGLIIAAFGLLHGSDGYLRRLDLTSGEVRVIAGRDEGLVASNMPVVASDGTIYCTHSKWGNPRTIGEVKGTGFIYRVTPAGIETYGEGLRGANGCCLDPEERYLYVALTAEGRVQRWRRATDGSLHSPEYFGPVLGAVEPDQTIQAIRALPPSGRARLGYCDGVAFDRSGRLWVTLPFAEKIVAIDPAGDVEVAVDDPAVLSMPTNIAWRGADDRDLYIVSRASGTIARCRTAVPGVVSKQNCIDGQNSVA